MLSTFSVFLTRIYSGYFHPLWDLGFNFLLHCDQMCFRLKAYVYPHFSVPLFFFSSLSNTLMYPLFYMQSIRSHSPLSPVSISLPRLNFIDARSVKEGESEL